jgi:DHA2 family multidrug resistance protein-like MFS transporter
LLLLVGIIGLAVGLTPVLTLVTEMVVGNTPPEQAGSASALLQTGQEFGAAVGIAVLGSIGATVYSHSGALAAPAGVPEAATDAARETIGSAVSQASQLGGDAGSTLLDAARTAFTEELQVAAVAGGIVMALAAVFSFIMLRHIKSDSLLATTDVEVVTEVQTKEEAALVR